MCAWSCSETDLRPDSLIKYTVALLLRLSTPFSSTDVSPCPINIRSNQWKGLYCQSQAGYSRHVWRGPLSICGRKKPPGIKISHSAQCYTEINFTCLELISFWSNTHKCFPPAPTLKSLKLSHQLKCKIAVIITSIWVFFFFCVFVFKLFGHKNSLLAQDKSMFLKLKDSFVQQLNFTFATE